MKNLDFVIIGAQKCATTTLFELLRQHPQIAMPLEKEVPFFTGDDYSQDAWKTFAQRYFGHDDGRLWGKASPQYMASEKVPARLAASMPKTKLVAILRDPLERCRSHYRMGRRRQTETRSFNEAITENLQAQALSNARRGAIPRHESGYESEGAFYIAWSEYGRVLRAYRQHFSQQQLLVLYAEDLQAQPAKVLQQVLDFLDLDGDFHPQGLGEVMHAGGGETRIPHGVRHWFRSYTPVGYLWQFIPAELQGRIRFLYERWNCRKTKEPLPLDGPTEGRLRKHFAQDLTELSALNLPSPPWAAVYGLGNGNG